MRRPIADLLKELEASDEHSRLEAKSGYGRSALETVSAFSNEPGQDGGYLLFGVKRDEDPPYKVLGVPKPDELTQLLPRSATTTR